MIDHVAYLPGGDPESLLLSLLGSPAPADGAEGAKKEWADRTHSAMGKKDWQEVTSADILSEEVRALGRVGDDAPELIQISERVASLLR